MERGGQWFGAAAAVLVAAGAAANAWAEGSSVPAPGNGPEAMRNLHRTNDLHLGGGSAVDGRLLALRAGRQQERGALPASGRLSAAGDLLTRTLHRSWDGTAGALDERWGGFVAANRPVGAAREWGSAEAERPDHGLAGGVDYRFTPALAGGVALSWSRAARESRRGANEVETDNWGLSAYASYSVGDWYVDGRLGFSRLGYQARRGNGLELPFGVSASARDSAEGNQWAATVGAGYDLHARELIVTPYSRVNYVRLKLDSFTEREPGAGPDSDLGSRSTESLQSALGVRLSSAMRLDHRAITPYVALEWNREFSERRAALTAPYTPDPFTTFFAIPSDRPVRDFVTVSLGLASVHGRGLSAFAKLDTVLGRDRAPAHAVVIGVRGQF